VGTGEAVSPDEKLLAFNAELMNPAAPQSALDKLALVSLDKASGPSPLLLEIDPRISGGAHNGPFVSTLSFTPDGKSVAYIIHDKGVDNIWAQPIDGSPGHQITNFTSEGISKFRWSPDGKTLAVARSHNIADVVLLREK
jgi:Tol biopolymer transport system component